MDDSLSEPLPTFSLRTGCPLLRTHTSPQPHRLPFHSPEHRPRRLRCMPFVSSPFLSGRSPFQCLSSTSAASEPPAGQERGHRGVMKVAGHVPGHLGPPLTLGAAGWGDLLSRGGEARGCHPKPIHRKPDPTRLISDLKPGGQHNGSGGVSRAPCTHPPSHGGAGVPRSRPPAEGNRAP